MKKCMLSMVALFILAFLISCTTDEHIKNESDTFITNQDIYDFTDYNFMKNSFKIVEQDSNFYFYRNVRHDSSGEFEINRYIINLNDSKGRSINKISMFDDNFAYYSCDSNEENNGELGIIDYKKNSYQKILELSKGSQACINSVNENYIVWKESLNDSNWGLTRLHLYDIKSMKDIFFYNNAIDVDTKSVYAWNWSNPVIADDIIYFDDIVSVKNNIYIVNMYSYNIKDEKINEIKSMAKWPIKYNNGIIWQQLNSDGINTDIIFYNGVDTNYLFSFKNQSVASFNANKECFAIINMLNSEMFRAEEKKEFDSFDSSGLQIFSNKILQQVLRTKPTVYIQDPKICGEYISFQLNTENKFSPIIFNLKSDEIILLDNIPKDYYSTFFTEENGYFVSESNNKMHIYKLLLK